MKVWHTAPTNRFHLPESLKIVNMAGGLGNQMFQYAFATMLQQHFPEDQVMVDTQHYHTLMFKKFRSVNLHNGYEISRLFANATLPVARREDLRRVTRHIPNYVLSRLARHLLPRLKTEYVAPYTENFMRRDDVLVPGDRYYEGYWECHAYYAGMKPLLRHVFTPPKPNVYNEEMCKRIEQSDSIGIHVRRGDYKNAPEYNGICTTDYYAEALRRATKTGRRHTIFVFSNDISWCRSHLPAMAGGQQMTFVDGNRGTDSCWDMFLMTHCRQLIIANSTFSWWGAFLNPRAEHVFAPGTWLHRDCPIEIHAPEWEKIH